MSLADFSILYCMIIIYLLFIVFSVSSDIEELKLMLGIGGEAEQNLHDAFIAVMEGDERPLLKLGMPEEEWYDVQYNLNKLIEGGLQV